MRDEDSYLRKMGMVWVFLSATKNPVPSLFNRDSFFGLYGWLQGKNSVRTAAFLDSCAENTQNV